jgi:sulfite reductase alpha subunit
MQPLHALHQYDARALRIGKDTGASVLFGVRPDLRGPQLSTLTIPFMKMEEPFSELKELIERCGMVV